MFVDVTEKIIGKHIISVCNKTFGDPLVGAIKQLYLFYSDEICCIYPEHSDIDLDNNIISTRRVDRAIYGTNNDFLDVTDIIMNQNSKFTVTNKLFTDPCVGSIKYLIVNSNQRKLEYIEGSEVNPSNWIINSPYVMYM